MSWFSEFASHGAVVADCGLCVARSCVLASFGVLVVVFHMSFLWDRE